ncbi:hypothetical protein BsWGS_18068 [Bradybaena similaris]
MTDVDRKSSVKQLRPSTISTTDSIYPAKSARSKCACCCSWCQQDPVFDEELAQIVGDRKRRKSTEGVSKHDSYLTKKDGCVETGYFVRPQPRGAKTLAGLRKTCKTTKNLPAPSIAIEINNAKYERKLNFKNVFSTSEDGNVSEINKMLRNRLTGTINLEPNDPNEESEALLSYHAHRIDVQPLILSQLVQGSDTRRMSVTAESDRNRRRSSFALRSIDMSSIEQSIYDSVYSRLNNKMKDTNDADFINSLPKISKLLKNELESNLPHTQRYIKNLKTLFKNTKFADEGKQKRSTERWMVILYTTSEERINTLTDFNCNLVRLILQHHCIAYEERDIALKKHPYRNQLKKAMGTDDIRVPFVCAKGISVGGVQVIFAMHKMKVLDNIFTDFIMPASVYVEWLYSRTKQKSHLSLNVKLSGYPALNQILTGNHPAYLLRSDRQIVKLGKVTIKKARESWNLISQEPYVQPSLWKFVLLKNTIIRAYSILNSVFLEYMPGQRKADFINRCCRWCR